MYIPAICTYIYTMYIHHVHTNIHVQYVHIHTYTVYIHTHIGLLVFYLENENLGKTPPKVGSGM